MRAVLGDDGSISLSSGLSVVASSKEVERSTEGTKDGVANAGFWILLLGVVLIVILLISGGMECSSLAFEFKVGGRRRVGGGRCR